MNELKPKAKYNAWHDKQLFRDVLVAWFQQNQKPYPWRQTQDPYAILISEVMLQQTQIATVLGKEYYTRFLKRFPDVASLSEADESSILKAWEGLGYYRRVKKLQEAAREILKHHAGIFPSNLDDLLQLPGVGAYTAGALRAFAFNAPAVLVDGNVIRVFSRLRDEKACVDEAPMKKLIWQWAQELADDSRSRVYHAALMELGQQFCKVKLPDCLNCPVSDFCHATFPEQLPHKAKRQKIEIMDERAIWAINFQGQLLLAQSSKGNRRAGLWGLPLRNEINFNRNQLLLKTKYSITRYRVELSIYKALATEDVKPHERWFDFTELEHLAIAAPYRKAIELLLT